MDLANTHWKYTNIGPKKHYMRFIDHNDVPMFKEQWKQEWETSKIREEQNDYIFTDNLTMENTQPSPDKLRCNERVMKLEHYETQFRDECMMTDEIMNEESESDDDESRPLYCVIGNWDCSKIKQLSAEISSVKEQTFNMQTRLEDLCSVSLVFLEWLGILSNIQKRQEE